MSQSFSLEPWPEEMEKRFSELVRLEALGRIKPGERQELEDLIRKRRQFHHPMTPQEWEEIRRQQQATEKLIQALNEYASIHRISGQKRPTPKRKNNTSHTS